MVIFCNNLIIAKKSQDGITPASNRATLVYNNVLIGNFTLWAIGAWNMDVLKNNLIINSSVGICSEIGEKPVVKYNAAWNTRKSYYKFIPDSTNIIADPMMVNMNEGDYHLQKFSPLIDAGDPDIYDKDGSRSDIGLYGGPYGESYTYPDLAPQPPKNLKAELDSNRITLRWKKNTEADFSYYRIYRDTLPDFTYDSSKLIKETSDTLYSEVLNSKANRYYYKLTAVDSSGNQSVPGEEISVQVTGVNSNKLYANDYMLFQNYPNPFNPSTTISYRLKEKGYVKLSLYDIKGEKIAELINKEQSSGYYELSFNPSVINKTYAAGVYVYTMTIQDDEKRIIYSSQKKMMLLK